MEEEKQKILDIWKKAVKRYKQREIKLCKRYKVKLKPIEADEFYTIFQFENGVQFTIPYDENYEDYNLTGDALKFAEKYNEIVQDCYSDVDKDLEKEGFEKIDSEEYFSSWEKDGKEYSITHYAKKEEDVEIIKQEGGKFFSSQA